MTLEQKILEIEQRCVFPDISGTTITRILTDPQSPPPHLKWSVGFGALYELKKFYMGDTIEEAVNKAYEDSNWKNHL